MIDDMDELNAKLDRERDEFNAELDRKFQEATRKIIALAKEGEEKAKAQLIIDLVEKKMKKGLPTKKACKRVGVTKKEYKSALSLIEENNNK